MTTYTLLYPISLTKDKKDTISEVTLERLKAKDMKAASKFRDNPYEFSNHLIKASTGLTTIEIDELDALDHQNILSEIESFLSPTKI